MADAKITALSANTTPLGTDVTVIVDDPGGTPATQKITLANQNAIGRVKAIQSSASGTWFGSGTTNTDKIDTKVYFQVGTNTASGGTDKVITFPNAYSAAPNCIACTAGAGSANCWTEIIAISTTQLTIRQISSAGSTGSELYNWWAVGPQ